MKFWISSLFPIILFAATHVLTSPASEFGGPQASPGAFSAADISSFMSAVPDEILDLARKAFPGMTDVELFTKLLEGDEDALDKFASLELDAAAPRAEVEANKPELKVMPVEIEQNRLATGARVRKPIRGGAETSPGTFDSMQFASVVVQPPKASTSQNEPIPQSSGTLPSVSPVLRQQSQAIPQQQNIVPGAMPIPPHIAAEFKAVLTQMGVPISKVLITKPSGEAYFNPSSLTESQMMEFVSLMDSRNTPPPNANAGPSPAAPQTIPQQQQLPTLTPAEKTLIEKYLVEMGISPKEIIIGGEDGGNAQFNHYVLTSEQKLQLERLARNSAGPAPPNKPAPAPTPALTPPDTDREHLLLTYSPYSPLQTSPPLAKDPRGGPALIDTSKLTPEQLAAIANILNPSSAPQPVRNPEQPYIPTNFRDILPPRVPSQPPIYPDNQLATPHNPLYTYDVSLLNHADPYHIFDPTDPRSDRARVRKLPPIPNAQTRHQINTSICTTRFSGSPSGPPKFTDCSRAITNILPNIMTPQICKESKGWPIQKHAASEFGTCRVVVKNVNGKAGCAELDKVKHMAGRILKECADRSGSGRDRRLRRVEGKVSYLFVNEELNKWDVMEVGLERAVY